VTNFLSVNRIIVFVRASFWEIPQLLYVSKYMWCVMDTYKCLLYEGFLINMVSLAIVIKWLFIIALTVAHLVHGLKMSTAVKIELLTGDEIWEHHFAFHTKRDVCSLGSWRSNWKVLNSTVIRKCKWLLMVVKWELNYQCDGTFKLCHSGINTWMWSRSMVKSNDT
jgi:hypothetical protein